MNLVTDDQIYIDRQVMGKHWFNHQIWKYIFQFESACFMVSASKESTTVNPNRFHSAALWIVFSATSEPNISAGSGQRLCLLYRKSLSVRSRSDCCQSWPALTVWAPWREQGFPKKRKTTRHQNNRIINQPSPQAVGCLVVSPCPFTSSLTPVYWQRSSGFERSEFKPPGRHLWWHAKFY